MDKMIELMTATQQFDLSLSQVDRTVSQANERNKCLGYLKSVSRVLRKEFDIENPPDCPEQAEKSLIEHTNKVDELAAEIVARSNPLLRSFTESFSDYV